MAAKFEVNSTKGDLFQFDPCDVIVKAKLNGRHELPDIEWLIEDIVKNGQIQPVIVRREEGKPVLVLGYSRWRAVREINKRGLTPAPVKLKCVFSQCSEMEGFLMNLSENLVRNRTSDLDDAHNVRLLEKWGQTHAEIAAVYKKSESWVKKCLKIASCEPEVLKAVGDGRLKLSAVAAIAKLSSDDQREKVKGEGKVEISAPEVSKIPTRAAIAKMLDKFEDAAKSYLLSVEWEQASNGWAKGKNEALSTWEALDIEGIE